jgi:hypothetical protein
VSGNKVLWRRFDLREEVLEKITLWGIIFILHKMLLRLCYSTMVRWVGHVWYLGEQEMYSKFWYGNLMERDYLEGMCVHIKLTLQFILSWWVSVWTTWGWAQWWALVNMLMDIQVPGNLKSWPDERLLRAQGQTLQHLYGYIHFHVKQKNLFVHWKLKKW